MMALRIVAVVTVAVLVLPLSLKRLSSPILQYPDHGHGSDCHEASDHDPSKRCR
jgi:hypothetical protein